MFPYVVLHLHSFFVRIKVTFRQYGQPVDFQILFN